MSDSESVSDAQLVRELTLHACDGDPARAVAALTGAIILVANRCHDTAGVIGCAVDGLTKGRSLAAAAAQRAAAAAKAVGS